MGGGNFNNNPIGGGGFVQPKPAGGNFGRTNTNSVRSGGFGGGFGSSTGSGFGGSGFNTKPSGTGSNLKNMAGAGLAGGAIGGLLGGKTKQYSSFGKPKKSFG